MILLALCLEAREGPAPLRLLQPHKLHRGLALHGLERVSRGGGQAHQGRHEVEPVLQEVDLLLELL